MNVFKISIIWFVAALFVVSCASETNKGVMNDSEKAAYQAMLGKVEPPMENVSVPYQKFSVKPGKEQSITTATGSEVHIPADAFVDENGDPVTAPVEIEYREFHSPAEIILSGIPMIYAQDGESGFFETAGMFEINGKSNGKQVFIAEGKQIDIDFVSTQDGDYHFYRFNKDGENKGWQLENQNQPAVKREIDKPSDYQYENVHQTKLPLKPVKFDPSNDLAININFDYEKFKELQALKGLIWKYNGEKDKKQIVALLSQNWDSKELIKNEDKELNYTLQLKKDNVTENIEIIPALSEKLYAQAAKNYEKKKKAIEDAERQRLAKLKANKQDYEFIRKVRINGFGIYNYDKISRQPMMALNADFSVKQKPEYDNASYTVFLVDRSRNMVIKYPKYAWKNFRFNTNSNNALVAILPDNKIATLSSHEFTTLDQFDLSNNEEFTFLLTEHEEEITEPGALDKVIHTL